ncbi:MAG TPA: ABC transporter ATP-binding protein, partial [Propionibacteriaceae bacterium]
MSAGRSTRRPQPVEAPAASSGLRAPERPKYQPSPGGRMFGQGPAPEKSISFGPSLRRLLGHLAPERMILIGVVALAVVGILLSVLGPRILGLATDVIFTGILGRQLPPGSTKEQAVQQLRAQGQDTYADMVERLGVTPGAGIDFGRLGQILLLALGLYLVSSAFLLLQGYLLNGAVQRSVFTLRNQVETKINRLP